MWPQFTIERSDPWHLTAPSGAPQLPITSSGPLDIPACGYGNASIVINHEEIDPVTIRVSAHGSISEVNILEVKLAEQFHGEIQGDELAPLYADRVTVLTSEAKHVHFLIKAPETPGIYNVQVVLATLGNWQSIDIPINVFAVSAEKPEAVVWAYPFHDPIKNHIPAAVQDMLDHGVTASVIPPQNLPFPAEAAAYQTPTIGQYELFDETLSLYKGHKIHLFFLGLAIPIYGLLNRNADFVFGEVPLAQNWIDLFKDWIKEWRDHMLALGHAYDDFAFYPYDEIHAGTFAQAVEVYRLIKEVDPRLKIYTTISRDFDVAPQDELTDLVDIFQVFRGRYDADFAAKAQGKGKEVWLYEAGGGSGTSLVWYYRAMAWEAFVFGLSGIGFWSYSRPDDATVPLFRPAVVYDNPSPSGLHSSKRWEAWREGGQDFTLLKAAFEKDPATTRVIAADKIRELALVGGDSVTVDFTQARKALVSIIGRNKDLVA